MDKSQILDELYAYGSFDTKVEFATFIGISPQNLSNWYKRGTLDPYLLASKFTNVNLCWIKTGEGSMLKNVWNEQQEHSARAAITIPAEVWEVIKNQAESLKHKDESIRTSARQLDEVIGMLKEQLNANKNAAM